MNIPEALKIKGIKVTQFRIRLLEVLESAKYPMQQKEIEELWGFNLDRVTLYRTLKSFSEKGIIHKIEVNESVTSYKLASINTESDEYIDHAHFHCSICGKVICLPQCEVKRFELPEGFEQIRGKVIIEGVCKFCNSKS